ncbi:hypothetical protein [Methanomassiliicoccus luminyensis]|uniref:hypothetical protein n=1 Tax=Methanomassiliicoccus luminyensis TaxID=1080712 RepID=UPI001F219C2F|nr:hypothetical protein [Methanomassiliicoccus luminyensis]
MIGSVLLAIATIEPQPMIYGIEISDIFAVCFFVAGALSLLAIINSGEKNGIVVTVILFFFGTIIAFGSLETLASLLPAFFIGDLLIGAIAAIRRRH